MKVIGAERSLVQGDSLGIPAWFWALHDVVELAGAPPPIMSTRRA